MELPKYYFRLRDNGAAVFLVNPDDQKGRVEMTQIAIVNIKNQEIRSHGDHELSDEDRQVISEWLFERQDIIAEREVERVFTTIEALNLMTHWVQTRSQPEELALVTSPLLLAMHDLRQALMRRQNIGRAKAV